MCSMWPASERARQRHSVTCEAASRRSAEARKFLLSAYKLRPGRAGAGPDRPGTATQPTHRPVADGGQIPRCGLHARLGSLTRGLGLYGRGLHGGQNARTRQNQRGHRTFGRENELVLCGDGTGVGLYDLQLKICRTGSVQLGQGSIEGEVGLGFRQRRLGQREVNLQIPLGRQELVRFG